jgi:hypothetical protein
MVTEAPQHFAGHRPVVESDGLVFQYLIRFVPFSGQNYNVPSGRASLMARSMAVARSGSTSRGTSVHAANPDQRIVHDGQRIFRARVVAGQHDEIAILRRRLPHQRTLGAVAVAAASEQRDDALGIRPRATAITFAARRRYGRSPPPPRTAGLRRFARSAPARRALRDARRDGFRRQAVLSPAQHAARMLYTLILPISGDSTREARFAALHLEAQSLAETGGDVPRAQVGLFGRARTTALVCREMQRDGTISSSRFSTAQAGGGPPGASNSNSCLAAK